MLYIALVPSMFSDLSSVADCTDAVSTWFMENALLLNPGTVSYTHLTLPTIYSV